jgi:proteasome assembly chaperone (PAC2) family protein
VSELNVSSLPTLRRPVLIAAFRGWNDGGQGATLGAGYLAKLWRAERFAEIDPDGFYDFQVVRPQVSLEEGLTRKLEWPENAFFHAPIQGLDRDAVLLLGIEPNVRWKTFTGLVVGLAQELGVELVVTLGSLLADVPHTRPAPVSAAASEPALVEELGVEPSRYEGPTGIVGVLLDRCRAAGLPSISLWAAVPHYVSLAPSPRAALALCRRFGELVGAEIDVDELEQASSDYTEQVTEAVSADEETAAYVEELERRVDLIEAADDLPSGESLAAEDLPSGESLAAELSRFLREREQEEPGEDEGPTGPAS